MSSMIRPGFLLTVICLLIFSCGSEEESIYPSRGNITESVYASGTVKARSQYQVFAVATGIIEQILVQDGDSVRKGDPIVTIYNEAGRLNRESAELARAFSSRQANQDRLRDLEINIGVLKSQFENDSLMFERQKRLRGQGVGSEADYERRELTFRNSRASYQASKIRLDELKREIDFQDRQASKNVQISKALEDDYLVTSKIDGLVYTVLKEEGELVSPQSAIAIIGDASEFILELEVDEYDIARVKLGQKIYISMDSYKGEVFEAIITRINPFMNQVSKSFTVDADFITKPPQLYPFLTLEANIVIQDREDVLIIPRNYLFQDRYVITSDKDTIPVEVGIKDFQKTEIISGINETTALIRPM
ncbi:MAG TPA: efflux RND transporter periplasmic adaptor subunit [Anditalea sp.]|nr:efflux RND transporter periplasmic adaptor subunit [Anditalea sp.]